MSRRSARVETANPLGHNVDLPCPITGEPNPLGLIWRTVDRPGAFNCCPSCAVVDRAAIKEIAIPRSGDAKPKAQPMFLIYRRRDDGRVEFQTKEQSEEESVQGLYRTFREDPRDARRFETQRDAEREALLHDATVVGERGLGRLGFGSEQGLDL